MKPGEMFNPHGTVYLKDLALAFACAPDLTPQQARLLTVLALKYTHREKGEAYPKQETLAEDLGLKRRATLSEWLATLKEHPDARIVEEPERRMRIVDHPRVRIIESKDEQGRNLVNRYILRWHPDYESALLDPRRKSVHGEPVHVDLAKSANPYTTLSDSSTLSDLPEEAPQKNDPQQQQRAPAAVVGGGDPLDSILENPLAQTVLTALRAIPAFAGTTLRKRNGEPHPWVTELAQMADALDEVTAENIAQVRIPRLAATGEYSTPVLLVRQAAGEEIAYRERWRAQSDDLKEKLDQAIEKQDVPWLRWLAACEFGSISRPAREALEELESPKPRRPDEILKRLLGGKLIQGVSEYNLKVYRLYREVLPECRRNAEARRKVAERLGIAPSAVYNHLRRVDIGVKRAAQRKRT